MTINNNDDKAPETMVVVLPNGGLSYLWCYAKVSLPHHNLTNTEGLHLRTSPTTMRQEQKIEQVKQLNLNLGQTLIWTWLMKHSYG